MDSLQLAVAAYIAEHGSIDATTYQALTDLYTTEISASTAIDANVKRSEQKWKDAVHNFEHPSKEANKAAIHSNAKLVNTRLLSAKTLANKLIKACEEVSKLKPLPENYTDSEEGALRAKLRSFGRTLNKIVDDVDEYNEKISKVDTMDT